MNSEFKRLKAPAAPAEHTSEVTVGKYGAYSSEPWWDELLTNRSLAAYQIGRLLNQLCFHLQESYLLSNRPNQLIHELFNRLIQASYGLLPAGSVDNPVENAVERERQEWSEFLESEEFGEDLYEAFNPDYSEELSARDRRRGRFTGRVEPTITALHDATCRLFFGGHEKQVLELGELVDDGIRPADVWRFMDLPKTESRPGFVGGWSREASSRLGEYMPAVGECAPRHAWAIKVVQELRRVGIREDVSTLLPEVENGAVGTRRELLAQLDKVIRRGLTALTSSQEPQVSSADGSGSQNARDLASDSGDAREPRCLAGPPRAPLDAQKVAALRASKMRFQKGVDEQDRYIGESPGFLHVFRDLEVLCESRLPFLILGEIGVGKTFLVNHIHQKYRPGRVCKMFTAAEFEIADFGIAKHNLMGVDAYSGLAGLPEEGRQSIIEDCNGGTLFIDELAEIPTTLQKLLLRLLQDECIERTVIVPKSEMENTPKVYRASSDSALVRRHESTDLAKRAKTTIAVKRIPIDVQFIFATNEHPDDLVEAGRLRRDLMSRLAGPSLWIPPLRERRIDILKLINRFLSNWGEKDGVSYTATDGLLAALMKYEWKTNIRGLEINLKLMTKMALVDSRNADLRGRDKDQSGDGQQSVEQKAAKGPRLELTSEHLRSLHSGIDDEVGQMKGQDAKRVIYQAIADELQCLGYKKGDRNLPLQEEMARLLGKLPETISRDLQTLGINV
jgi:DNA-binding NtrC family response regulator